jgi:hypothetical protein
MSQGWKAELIFAGSVAKRDGEQNEDRFRVDEAALCFALSDGASVSYDPATWAELLCNKFIENSAFDAGRNVSTTLRQWHLDFRLDFPPLSLVG